MAKLNVEDLTPEAIEHLRKILAPTSDAATIAEAIKAALAPPDYEKLTRSKFNIEEIAKEQHANGQVATIVKVKCQTDSGYKYTACVAPSREFKMGRVVSIEDEEAPKIDWPANGSHHDEKGELNIHGKHYVWETFRQPLFRDVIGHELKWHHQVSAKPIFDKLKAEFEAKAMQAVAELAARTENSA
jgi:hypothetical protein